MLLVLAVALLAASSEAVLSLKSFGAVPNVGNSLTVAKKNAAALEEALVASSVTRQPLVVTASEDYTFFSVLVANRPGVTLVLDGVFRIFDNITEWPTINNDGGSFCCFFFSECDNLSLSGTGEINGHGYAWWWFVIITGVDKRPHMLGIHRSENVTISNLRFVDSPQFHVYLTDVKHARVSRVNITVNVEQRNIFAEIGNGIPVFPLNTDGIDPSGIDIVIQDSFIQNFDDAVAVKTTNSRSGKFSNCTENVIVRNMTIIFSVGATIGSVTPEVNSILKNFTFFSLICFFFLKDAISCIRNVTFENIIFHDAFKAIYIKSNPGTSGAGIIENILYRDIISFGSLWYPIWIGPQQEKQPGQPGKVRNLNFQIFFKFFSNFFQIFFKFFCKIRDARFFSLFPVKVAKQTGE